LTRELQSISADLWRITTRRPSALVPPGTAQILPLLRQNRATARQHIVRAGLPQMPAPGIMPKNQAKGSESEVGERRACNLPRFAEDFRKFCRQLDIFEFFAVLFAISSSK
jgi:hypothetical protein